MKQAQVAISFIASTLFLFSPLFAHSSLKNETTPLPSANNDWTGFYLGLNVGVVNHTLNMTDTASASFRSTIQQVSNPNLTGGFQVGYRRLLDLTKASGVYGLELSTNFSNADYSKQYGSPFATYQLNSNNQLKNVSLLELIGGIAADNTLLFFAAGISWVNITGHTTNADAVAFFNSFSVGRQKFGTAIGAGIEYAINEKFSARFKVDVATPSTYTTTDDSNNVYQISNNIVLGTVGINYRFG